MKGASMATTAGHRVVRLVCEQLDWACLRWSAVAKPINFLFAKFAPALVLFIALVWVADALTHAPAATWLIEQISSHLKVRMREILFGIFLLIVAAAIYFWKCPGLVQRYANWNLYFDDQSKLSYPDLPDAISTLKMTFTDAHPKRIDIDYKDGTPNAVRSAISAADLRQKMGLGQSSPGNVLRAYFILQDHSHFWWRLTCSVLLAVVAVIVFWREITSVWIAVRWTIMSS